MEPMQRVMEVEREIQRLRRLANKLEGELLNFCRMSLQPGQMKTKGGLTYVWKVGKSGKARWHRHGKARSMPKGYRVDKSQYSGGRGGTETDYYPVRSVERGKYPIDEPVYGKDAKVASELPAGASQRAYAGSRKDAFRRAEKSHALRRVADRPFIESMLADTDGDGVDEGARVGVPGKAVQPPPPLKRVRGLSGKQQVAEAEFITGYETRTKEYTDFAIWQAKDIGRKKNSAPIFETDAVKVLAGNHWEGMENRALNNVALHQAANAIAKRAFKQYLSELPKGSNVLVTCGGCGAGKGYVLGKNPQADKLKQSAAAIWDSAGDQNATENPWILEEARKHGHNVTYLYVHADPLTSWADPNRGVVQRANNPEDGRMVTARVFADSYALGAKNMKAFAAKEGSSPDVTIRYFRNGPNPEMIADIPPEAYYDSDQLYEYALGVIDQRHDIPGAIREAATFKFGT